MLPTASKIFERFLPRQVSSYVDKFLSPFICSYRKGFSTQQELLPFIERWKNTFHQNGNGGAMLSDLSNSFDTINHDLLITKLGAYGFDTESLKLNKSYLTNRLQKTKLNTIFSRTKLLLGVLQGSLLGSDFSTFIRYLY